MVTYGDGRVKRFVKRRKVNSGNTRSNATPQANLRILKSSEVKFKDIVFGSSVPSGGLVNLLLTDITQGTGRAERIGTNVHLLGVDLRGFAGAAGQQTTFYLNSRLDGGAPTIANYAAGCGAMPIDDTTKLWWMSVDGNEKGSGGKLRVRYRFRYPLKVYYSGTAGTTAVRNSVYLTQYNFASSANFPTYTCRVYWQDV